MFGDRGFVNTRLVDRNGDPYGVPHINNKPRVSAMPYLFDIAEGRVPGHFLLDKFGRNSAIGVSLEEMWEGNVVYPYLTAAEFLQVSSDDVDDQGNVVSTGNLTSGSDIVVTDTAATFITDGVAAGDIFINDSMIAILRKPESIAHGIIKSVDSEIQLTLELPLEIECNPNDVYRVVNANDSGAAVVQLGGLNSKYEEISEYVVLATGASTATLNKYLRIYRGVVRLVGSSRTNEGIISVKDNADVVTLAIITADFGQTLMAIWTVPAEHEFFLTTYYASEVNAKTTLFALIARPLGEAWQIKHSVEVKSSKFQHLFDTPKKFRQKTDIAVFGSAAAGAGQGSAGFAGWYETDDED